MPRRTRVRFPAVGRRWIEAVGAGEVLSPASQCAERDARVRRRRILVAARTQLLRDRDGQPVAAQFAGTGRASAARAAIQRCDARGVAGIVDRPRPRRHCSTTSTRPGRASAISRSPDSARSALDSLRGAELTVDASRDLADPSKMIPSLASYVRLATRAASAVTCATLDALNADSPTCDAAHGDLALALRYDARARRATRC